ncbi:pirin family protein [Flavobacterium caeni]|uniref:Quercetin 2,3-dioxygenase C-terminal cupin domain-containing protein n=1 Tax=Flavobacterium caeni TaxID=490189 RepID=A0A1G5G860_9FLAO|nr:hypothetical protein [Flavobacterium caeni]SCY47683.1 hypothetical protein SAMN02927903_01483 [Flavobacterium caeni]
MEHRVQIYKADFRGRVESEVFRRYATFNFDEYQEPSRGPLGGLLALNDETLGAGNTIFRHLDAHTSVLVLPLVGGLIFRDSFGHEDTIGTEQIGIFSGGQGNAYQLTNPYKNDLVNYLQIWFKTDKTKTGFSQRSFELDVRNNLVPIFGDKPMLQPNSLGFIGLYDGRQEGTYTLKNRKNGLFVFVINGAFEFDNRLIETRDGLSIVGAQTVEFEALSANAMLLLIEVPLCA